MKGIVFTEFLEMVEEKFGPNVADAMIVDSNVPTGGVYTAVGAYDHRELVAMVVELAKATGLPAATLVRVFGEHLFGRFSVLYPQFFSGTPDAFSFLSKIEDYIHPEVRKLYPDAELPHFDTKRLDSRTLELVYRSSRHFGDLAEGLIHGCLHHFKETADVQRQAVVEADGAEAIRFTLTRSA